MYIVICRLLYHVLSAVSYLVIQVTWRDTWLHILEHSPITVSFVRKVSIIHEILNNISVNIQTSTTSCVHCVSRVSSSREFSNSKCMTLTDKQQLTQQAENIQTFRDFYLWPNSPQPQVEFIKTSHDQVWFLFAHRYQLS